MVESILAYLASALLATLAQIGIILLPIIILALIIHLEARFTESRAIQFMGRGWYLGLFGWLGTVIHELGHAVFCVLFRHQIRDIKLFKPDPETGTLGYVKHAYKKNSLYQQAGNFFIGIGPILFGLAVLGAVIYFLLGINPFNLGGNWSNASAAPVSWSTLSLLLQNLWHSASGLLAGIFSWQAFNGWRVYVFLYLVLAVGSSLALSLSDIKSSLKGFILILILLVVFNLATAWMSDFTYKLLLGLAGYLGPFFGLALFVAMLNLAIALLVLVPLSLLRPQHAKSH